MSCPPDGGLEPGDPLFDDWPEEESAKERAENPGSSQEDSDDPKEETQSDSQPLSFVDRLILESIEKDESLVLAPKKKRPIEASEPEPAPETAPTQAEEPEPAPEAAPTQAVEPEEPEPTPEPAKLQAEEPEESEPAPEPAKLQVEEPEKPEPAPEPAPIQAEEPEKPEPAPEPTPIQVEEPEKPEPTPEPAPIQAEEPEPEPAPEPAPIQAEEPEDPEPLILEGPATEVDAIDHLFEGPSQPVEPIFSEVETRETDSQAADTMSFETRKEPETMELLTESHPLPKPIDSTLESVEEELSQEVIEFLKLVEQAEDDSNGPNIDISLTKDRPSPKKSFKMKSKEAPPSALQESQPPKILKPEQLDNSFVKSDQKPRKKSTAPRSIGGQLRDLEQALAHSEPGKLPSGIEKRSVAAISFLSRLDGTQRVMVVVEDDKGELQCTAAGGVEGEDYLQQTSQRLLRTVLRSNESKLLLDATKDARFSNDPALKAQGVRSALCAPFTDKVSGARGVLYVDNLQRDNAFTYQDLRNVESFCQRLATDTYLEGFEQVTTGPKASEELQAEVQQMDPRIYIAVAVILVLVMVPSLFSLFGSKEEDKPKGPTIVTRETADSKTVVVSFLRALETRNFRSAYQYLTQDRRAKISFDKFNGQAVKFMSEKGNSWIIARLDVVESTMNSDSLKTYDLIPPDDRLLRWKVTTQKLEGVWYVSSIREMGPLTF